jgi:hypothetical protein
MKLTFWISTLGIATLAAASQSVMFGQGGFGGPGGRGGGESSSYGGEGGMGLGGMGPGGGMAGYGGGSGFGGGPRVVTWKKPEGKEPFWLTHGIRSVEAEEAIRDKLCREASCDLTNATLDEFLSKLLEPSSIDSHVNMPSIESSGVEMDSLRVTIKSPKILIREALRRGLETHGLTYVVSESGITIVPVTGNTHVLRTYDLAYVQADNAGLLGILQALENVVTPNAWDSNGGRASYEVIGSRLIVYQSEEGHLEVERFLARINGATGTSYVRPRPLGPASGGMM